MSKHKKHKYNPEEKVDAFNAVTFEFRDMTISPAMAVQYLKSHPDAQMSYQRDYELEGCVRCLIEYVEKLRERKC